MTAIARDAGMSPASRRIGVLEFSSAASIVIGLVTLTAVLVGAPGLTAIVPGHVPVAANTGLCLLLLGTALLLGHSTDQRRRRAAAILTGAVGLIGLATAVQFALGAQWGLDRMLFPSPPGASTMSPQSAICFVLLAAALKHPSTRLFSVLARVALGLVAVLSLINLLDVLYGANIPTILAGHIQMALPTAAAMFGLSLAVMNARPGSIFDLLRLPGPAGALSRPLIVAAIVIPIVVGWVRLAGERAGLYDTAHGVAIVALTTIVLFLSAIRFAVRTVQRSEVSRQLAEEEREQARQAAIAANQAKSEFLSRMSHELRTPLNSVLGFAQLLEMDQLTDEQRESVRYIQRAGRHLLEMINEILDITRIDQGAISLSVEPVAMRDSIDEVVALIGPMAAERSISIEVSPITPSVEFVIADRQRLRQVLLNLLSNAVKYNKPGGLISVTCTTAPDGRVKVSIADTGRGIAPDALDRVFQPFDRLGAEATEIEGSGIGLALSKALMKVMGGDIGVESVPGTGSTFWISLPASPVGPTVPEVLADAAKDEPEGGLYSILYIEDNPANVRLVERILAITPAIRLHSVMRGETGIELARRHRPDLVLLDLHLPDIDGSEVLRRLRDDPTTASIPVLILSADGSQDRARRLLDEGAAGYLSKPINVAKFQAALARHLGTAAPQTTDAR